MDTIDKNKSSCETNLDAMITSMVPDKTKIKKYCIDDELIIRIYVSFVY